MIIIQLQCKPASDDTYASVVHNNDWKERFSASLPLPLHRFHLPPQSFLLLEHGVRPVKNYIDRPIKAFHESNGVVREYII